MSTKDEYLPIADYGLIGNLHTTALVSKQGSVDFLPFTRFDSPTIFAALLDAKKGGFFRIDAVEKDINHKQLYLPDTAILITRYLSEKGIVELTDFMPVLENEYHCALVRSLKGIKGELKFRVQISPRFEYGKYGFKIEKNKKEVIIYSDSGQKQAFKLMSDAELTYSEECICAEFTLKEKEELHFIIEALPENEEDRRRESIHYYSKEAFGETVDFWRGWVKKSKYNGRWKEMINRSAITLKLLTSYQYGSTVAAATFGLPEQIGGERNWDYRFTWVRDAAFTMYAFLRLGYTSEARQFLDWILKRSIDHEKAEDLKLMYRVDGSVDIDEEELSHLEGYRKSSPVRIGNGAFNQFQLDIYGDLIDTVYIYNKDGEPITYELWQNLQKFIDYIADNWKEEDHGIWEVRGEQHEFLMSKIMSWVALDRGILIATNRSFPAPLEHWRNTRDKIYQDIYNNYWNDKKQAFVQYRGSDTLDASALLIPLVRLLSPKEPRWLSTLKALEKELITDSLVYRYRLDQGASDGFKSNEGTFSMCSFWYIEGLAKAGQVDKAVLYFEKMLGYANHLGLFSEQIGLQGELLGNYPQAFTHLGLISAAYTLNKFLDEL